MMDDDGIFLKKSWNVQKKKFTAAERHAKTIIVLQLYAYYMVPSIAFSINLLSYTQNKYQK